MLLCSKQHQTISGANYMTSLCKYHVNNNSMHLYLLSNLLRTRILMIHMVFWEVLASLVPFHLLKPVCLPFLRASSFFRTQDLQSAHRSVWKAPKVAETAELKGLIEPGVDSDRLLDNKTILDELADVLARVGVGNLVDLIGIQPHLEQAIVRKGLYYYVCKIRPDSWKKNTLFLPHFMTPAAREPQGTHRGNRKLLWNAQS